MINDFKSFYFLHIPKTGGRIFRANVVDQIYRDIKNTDIEPIYSVVTSKDDWSAKIYPAASHSTTINSNQNDKIHDDGHAGWKKSINHNTYVVSTFREPIKQSVSLFAHMYDTELGNIDARGIRVRETDLSKVSKEDYLTWFTKYTQFYNFQIKNFIATDPDDWAKIEQTWTDQKIWGIKRNLEFGSQTAKDRIARTNLLIDEEELTDVGMQRAYWRICSNLKIEPKKLEFKENHKGFRNDLSFCIYNQLIPEEKSIIKKFLNLDYEIYEDRSLFTQLLFYKK